MSRLALVPILGLLLPACGAEQDSLFRTPAGHELAWENSGAVPSLYSREDLGRLFDAMVEDAAVYLARYGADEDLVRNLARSHRWKGFDAVRFSIGASPTGWATGVYDSRARAIGLAFWMRASGDVVPASAPWWTVYTWGALRPSPKYDWGIVPTQWPAGPHELGHAWAHVVYGPQLGGAFEHGWTPPFVSSSGLALLEELGGPVRDWSRDCVVVE